MGALVRAAFSLTVLMWMWWGATHPDMVNENRQRHGFNPLPPRSMCITAILATVFVAALTIWGAVAAIR